MFDFSKVRFQRAAVSVPEFVDLLTEESANGHVPEIVVRELTADEKADASRMTVVKGEEAWFDTGLVVYYGAVTGELEETGKGKRLFKSVNQVRDLSSGYSRALVRLANEILYLSGLTSRDADTAENTELEREKKG